jgi:poly(3-hydroxybutyrate) depolymerase
MSYALACSLAMVFRAVAILGGGQLRGCSGGTQPIAYLGVHGFRDSVLGISGGRAMRDRFVRNNGCTAQNPPEPAQGSTHRVTTYSGCSAGHPVAWAAFDEAGTTTIDGWALVFTLPGGQTVTSGWNADYSPASGRVMARNVSHNATIAPGASVDIGFQATHTGDTTSPKSHTLNATTCAVT